MMNHPFIGNLTELSMEDIQEKVSDLRNKLTFASRMGKYEMAKQIQMALANYQEEYVKRQQEMWDKTFKKKGENIKVEIDSSKYD